MQARSINAPSVHVPTTGYVQAREVSGHSRMLFISGQTPVDADGKVPDGFEAQLRAAGMTLDNLVMSRTYLADRRFGLANRAVRNEILGGRETALTVVVAGIFDENWLLEIEAVAAA